MQLAICKSQCCLCAQTNRSDFLPQLNTQSQKSQTWHDCCALDARFFQRPKQPKGFPVCLAVNHSHIENEGFAGCPDCLYVETSFMTTVKEKPPGLIQLRNRLGWFSLCWLCWFSDPVCCWCPPPDVHPGASDGAPGLAFASWSLQHKGRTQTHTHTHIEDVQNMFWTCRPTCMWQHKHWPHCTARHSVCWTAKV